MARVQCPASRGTKERTSQPTARSACPPDSPRKGTGLWREKVTREKNVGFMTVMLGGRCTDAYLAEAGGDSLKFTDDELKIISSPLDFVGINVDNPAGTSSPPTNLPATTTSRSTPHTRRCN